MSKYIFNIIVFFNNFIDLKNVSNYIGTRNIGQVRSHLQKYLLKQKKMKEKSNKIIGNQKNNGNKNNLEEKIDDKNEDNINNIEKVIELDENEEKKI